MKIAVVGTGYVGLVTGAGFSDFGHHVSCVDIDEERVATLRRGEVPFYEPGLHDLIQRNAALGRLEFTTSTREAVKDAEVVFIAVGTPSQPDGGADLTYVFEAAREIGRSIQGFTVIVTKSTVPVGTTARVREEVELVTRHPFAVASNPEFLKEGDALDDFLQPSRVILGVEDARATAVLRDLYHGFLRNTERVQVMDICSSELTKYAANCMLATRISFMNELALLCEAIGADVENVRKGIGADPRIGNKFLFAGAGFGGSCFPKDLRALIHTAQQHDIPLGVIDAAERANQRQKRLLGERVLAHFKDGARGKRIALWGLAFKPETDDIRDAPALVTIEQLLSAGATVVAYDPVAMPNIRRTLGSRIELANDAFAAASVSDALVLVTEWHEFRTPDFNRLKNVMRGDVLFDGRNVWLAEDARAKGFTYYGIGRSPEHRPTAGH